MDPDPQERGPGRPDPEPSPEGAQSALTFEPAPPPAQAQVPDRYAIKQDEDGRYLSCVEAPEVKIRLQRDLSVPAAAARKYPDGTIFLDGAALAAPFLDLERQIYNLDHHEGCVRRFTLAACEQALVLVLRGFDLRSRPWTVWANSPDLDTVLAIWVLCNAIHLAEKDSPIKRDVIPLVRLEGLIDSQGLELREFSGFSEPQLDKTTRRLDSLREAELQFQRLHQGENGLDLLELTAALLRRVDALIYPTGFFEDLPGVEELAREELGDDRIVVVCRSESGIYEIETALKRLYGRRLGLIVLQKDERTYTLRQVDTFLPVNLEAAYRRLNLLDPAVSGGGVANRWGGSGEIGGSPRRSGTDLDPWEIARACKIAFREPPLTDRLTSVAKAVLLSTLVVAAGWAAQALAVGSAPWTWSELPGGFLNFAATGLAAGLALLLALAARRRRRLFGIQRPAGAAWLWTAPAVVAGALAGGAWVAPAGPDGPWGTYHLASLLLLPLMAEVTFRGIAHGILVRHFSVQVSRGRWFLSWPAGVSALLYASWTAPIGHPAPSIPIPYWTGAPSALPVLGALVAGIALGVCRERSASLLPPLLLHYTAVAAVLALAAVLA